MSTRSYGQFRRQTNELFNPRTGGPVGIALDWFIMALIAANVAAVILETVDPIGTVYAGAFYWLEVFSVAIFSIEYVARVWSAVDDPNFQGPISGRLSFASRPLLVIDLLAILPFYGKFEAKASPFTAGMKPTTSIQPPTMA